MTDSDEDEVTAHRTSARRSDAVRPPRKTGDRDDARERGDDVDDLDADIAVEEDTIETVDPDNAPA